jgi:hypothetical protein
MRIFDIQRLARAFAAMFLDLPHLAARYPTQIFSDKSLAVFQSDHREVAYYAAALALYRLEVALGNLNSNSLPAAARATKWHVLMVLRKQIAGKNAPPLSSPKIEAYCKKIVDTFQVGGKPCLPQIKQAVAAVESVSKSPSRDQLKRQKFTSDLLEQL